jgi:hypothetical protein
MSVRPDEEARRRPLLSRVLEAAVRVADISMESGSQPARPEDVHHHKIVHEFVHIRHADREYRRLMSPA